MNPTVNLSLIGIIPLAIVLAGMLPMRRAILATLIVGWLFLPIAKLPLAGIPDYDKIVAANLAMFLGCLAFDGRRVTAVRLSWIDVPMLLWCLAPACSSVANDLGYYDAMSAGVRQTLMWFLPYWIGRCYFRDLASMRELTLAVVLGGLIYVPLCLLEIRISPQLHKLAYGFQQVQFWRNVRFDGFRPVLFMQNGLMVGTWMAASTVVAFWLWRTGTKRMFYLPAAAVCGVLLATTILCKALYAILLMLAAIGLLEAVRWGRTRLPLVVLLLCVPAYMIVRSTDAIPNSVVVEPAARLFGADRAQSLEARLLQEQALLDHVKTRPIFGWGGWKRAWPTDPYTEEPLLRGIDGLWTIALGETGLFGLIALFTAMLLPVASILWRLRPALLNDAAQGPVVAMAVCLLMFACDCLLNGMFNPLYILTAGGLAQWRTDPLAVGDVPAALPQPVLAPRRLKWYAN